MTGLNVSLKCAVTCLWYCVYHFLVDDLCVLCDQYICDQYIARLNNGCFTSSACNCFIGIVCFRMCVYVLYCSVLLFLHHFFHPT